MNSAPSFQQSFSPFKRGRFTKEESTKRAFTFSLIAHLGLLAFLMIGISWNNTTSSGVEVELWDSAPQVEAPPEPELKTEVKEEAADIAIKKKKVEKEPPKKEVKETPKAIKPPPPKEKEKPKKEEPPKKAEAPKAQSPAETKANAAAEKARADQLARLRAAAGAEGGRGGTVGSGVGGGGNAPPGWTDKVIKKVKPLIVFNPESVSGNPAAVILVSLAPDGAILSTSIQSSSGNAGWDRAVLLALSRAESLPKDDNGKIPQREVKLTFKPKD
ncbi:MULTISPECIES: cell envelope integrity protein TolA [unclassified Polynucleobacter]|jgi:colicin import membrane protein|uniref:cell envelope integrity protein TolA n=1 Tax=unclassified Polynucleobacter TaxID=2640945 RepID=UPI001C0A93BE|nr:MULTISPECIES: cell envelope integrity protein TolA [unclassified Polynucleobacter]MBU3563574.1 cell envelope integrity protein TolA [Polynucleobacter sp. Tro8-14-1]MBU3641120.1 cell envelope integrity protein TolA [Polynucleobacter sp. Fuers-14]